MSIYLLYYVAVCNFFSTCLTGGASCVMFNARGSFCFRGNVFCLFLLITVWFIGLFLGIGIYDPMYSSLMCSVLLQPVSIVGLVMILFLPLFSVYVSLILNKPIISVIVCFLKAVSFGFTGCLITHNYGNASWLVRLLFLFSDHCCVILLFVFWFYFFCSFASNRTKYHSVFFLIAVLIAMFDYFVISPFMRGLF